MNGPLTSRLSPPVSKVLAGLTRTTRLVFKPKPKPKPAPKPEPKPEPKPVAPQPLPKPIEARLPRPSPVVWALILACLGAMLAVAGGIAVLGWRARHLVEEIRLREIRLAQAAAVRLPSEEALLSDERFRALSEAYPQEAARFGCARARVLANQGRLADAAAAWREAAAWSTRGLPVAERLALAEVLFRLRRYDDAAAELKRLDATADEGERAKAVDLLGRLQLVRLTGGLRG